MFPRTSRISAAAAGLALALAPAAAAHADTVKPMVIGGDAAKAGQFPFMAEIFNSAPNNGGPGTNYCSGTLIAPDLVLTSGQCLPGEQKSYISVGNTTFLEGKPKAIEVAQWFKNPAASPTPRPQRTDLAIAKLSKPVTDVKPIEFNRAVKVGDLGQILGYGMTGTSGTVETGDLKAVETKVRATSECSENIINAGVDLCLRSDVLAADGKPAMATLDDTGGAFVTGNATDGWKLAGTYSRNVRGERVNVAVGFHSDAVISWIDSVVAQNKAK